MGDLKILGALAVGAIILAVLYSFVAEERTMFVSVDEESGRAIRQLTSGERGSFSISDGAVEFAAKWTGDFELNEAGDAITDLDDRLEITLTEGGVTRRVEFEDSDNGVRTIYFIDDDQQPDDARAEAGARALLQQFLRMSGVEADERVESLLEQNGVDAVLEEIRAITADTGRRRYAQALAGEIALSNIEVAALADALTAISSDYELRQALVTIIENQTLSENAIQSVLSAAQGIESDHDLRLVIEAICEHYSSREAIAGAIALADNIESDHDRRVALSAVAENIDEDDEDLIKAYRNAAGAISSEYDRKRALEEIDE